jgi:hypothetical protein
MNEESLFTFLVEYKGGTYVKQLSAPSVSSALNVWRTKGLEEVAELSDTSLAHFAGLRSDFVQLDGSINVWCLTASIDDAFFLMNIVATAAEEK